MKLGKRCTAGLNNMTNAQLIQLEQVIDGQMYSESVIDAAIEQADKLKNLEARVLLQSLKSGRTSSQARMTLQRFVCDLKELFKQ